jgi:hypothetical protein
LPIKLMRSIAVDGSYRPLFPKPYPLFPL